MLALDGWWKARGQFSRSIGNAKRRLRIEEMQCSLKKTTLSQVLIRHSNDRLRAISVLHGFKRVRGTGTRFESSTSPANMFVQRQGFGISPASSGVAERRSSDCHQCSDPARLSDLKPSEVFGAMIENRKHPSCPLEPHSPVLVNTDSLVRSASAMAAKSTARPRLMRQYPVAPIHLQARKPRDRGRAAWDLGPQPAAWRTWRTQGLRSLKHLPRLG